jgi:hypothetical protein
MKIKIYEVQDFRVVTVVMTVVLTVVLTVEA